ncbi:type II toxin-antitoxin system VapC family toxin [soil metagenome]|jgi:toxin-antitoxin system PIN domain toxin
MIVPDVNLLVYAHDIQAADHVAARQWWESAVNSQVRVGLAWVVVLGFIRVTTHPSILRKPLTVLETVERISGWLSCANVEMLDPGREHWDNLRGSMLEIGVGGNLTTDAHLAVLAREHGAELHSSDSDFSRFVGLRWRNPLKRAK